MQIAEYLLLKYGSAKNQPTAAGKVDDLYCEFVAQDTGLLLMYTDIGTHFAEGTMMPPLVNKYVHVGFSKTIGLLTTTYQDIVHGCAPNGTLLPASYFEFSFRRPLQSSR